MKRCSLAVLMTALLLGVGIAQDAPKGDHDKIQGAWKVISMETRENPGKKVPDDKIKDLKVVITKDKLEIRTGKEPVVGYKFNKVDPTTKPKGIDLALVLKDGSDKPTLGIYELDGDELKLCIGDPSPEPKRPTEFEVSKRGLFLLVLKRDKN